MVLGAIAVFVIEKQFLRAAAFALVGAMLTFFGLIHGESVGIGEAPAVAASYLLFSVFLVGIARFAPTTESVSPGAGAVSEALADKMK